MKPTMYRVLGLAMMAGGVAIGTMLVYRMTADGAPQDAERGPFKAIVVCAVAALTGLGLVWHGRRGDQPEPADAPNALDEIRALLAQGRTIEAIKRHRELTGAGLAESKDAVEAMQRKAA